MEDELGCCGYDELAEKPETTRPMTYPGIPVSNIAKSDGPGVTRRMMMGSPRLGQVALVLGPSSWGAGGVPVPAYDPTGVPPYFGQWGALRGGSGQVGPFDTIDEAFDAAVAAAVAHGATELPTDGWAQVVDSRGGSVGPVT